MAIGQHAETRRAERFLNGLRIGPSCDNSRTIRSVSLGILHLDRGRKALRLLLDAGRRVATHQHLVTDSQMRMADLAAPHFINSSRRKSGFYSSTSRHSWR